MRYEWTAIPDGEVPAAEPAWRHVVATYASEANKTASVWRAIPDDRLDFKPHEKVNTIRTILVHQLLSERRFFGQFVGTDEPPVDELLPPGESPPVAAYIERYVGLCKRRLPQFAAGTTAWWLEPRPFFGGLVRERVWVFWRRVLHTCHHRTQVQTWLRLAGDASTSDLRPVRGRDLGRGRPDVLVAGGEPGGDVTPSRSGEWELGGSCFRSQTVGGRYSAAASCNRPTPISSYLLLLSYPDSHHRRATRADRHGHFGTENSGSEPVTPGCHRASSAI